jgi:hypothetical protein
LGCVCFIRAGDTGCGGGRVYRINTLQYAASAAPRDRMVGSFFAMSHLPKN